MHFQVSKGRLALAENRNRFLESKTSSLSNKISRMESHVSSLESSAKRYEVEQRGLRTQCEQLEKQLLACQEKALLYMQLCAAGKLPFGLPTAAGSTPTAVSPIPQMSSLQDVNNVKCLLEDLLKSSSLLKTTGTEAWRVTELGYSW